MANILKVHEQNTIQQLKDQGWSLRRIARELKLDRKTVRRYATTISKSPTISTPGSTGSEASKSSISTSGTQGGESPLQEPQFSVGRLSLCEPYRERILSALENGLSAQRIYQDLVAEVQFNGSYQSVKRFVKGIVQEHPERVWRVEVEPGEELQIDFCRGAPVVDEVGHHRRCWVLRGVLSYSRKAYSEAIFNQTTENLIRMLENAFRSFGGSAKTINLDNMRAAVQKADWCDPELNPKLVAFCRHYGSVLLPCRIKTPEHKGKNERGNSYIKSNALRGRVFKGLALENEFLRHWEKTVADLRIHGTTRKQVISMFAEEQKALLPLPPDLFPCFEEGKRTVHRDSYIEVAKAYYSVPPEYIGQWLWVRWDGREVRIFNQRWEQVALKIRLQPGQRDKVLGLGGGQGPLERQVDYWIKRAQELGTACGLWSQGMIEHKGPIGIRSIMGLVNLTNHHSFKKLNDACASALSRGAWRLRDVRTLLDQHPGEIQTYMNFAQNHPLIRNLAEYGMFIKIKTHDS